MSLPEICINNGPIMLLFALLAGKFINRPMCGGTYCDNCDVYI